MLKPKPTLTHFGFQQERSDPKLLMANITILCFSRNGATIVTLAK